VRENCVALTDDGKRACRQASAAQGAFPGGFVQGLFSVAMYSEGIELFRAGGNAAAAAAASIRFNNYGSGGDGA